MFILAWTWDKKVMEELTCNLFSRLVSVFEPMLCFAAFQNCFWAEYLFMGHILNKQSKKLIHQCTVEVLLSQMLPLNFLGGFVRSPAPGHTTHLSSTRLKFHVDCGLI